MTATALTLITPHGEALEAIDAATVLHAAGLSDLAAATLTDCAEFDARARLMEQITREARGIANGEIVRRLDADARWTVREGDFKFVAPSPNAGTTGYDADALAVVLARLVSDGVVSQAAMDAAVRDTSPGPVVSWELLSRMREGLEGGYTDPPEVVELVEIADELLATRKAPRWLVTRGGVDRLVKVGGVVAAAVEACRVELPAPARTAKITREPTS